MNRLLTVTISALFLVLLISSVSFDSAALDVNDFSYSNYGLSQPSQAQIDWLTIGGRNHIALIKGWYYEGTVKYRLISTAEIFYYGDPLNGFYEKYGSRFEGNSTYPDTHYYEWNGTQWISGSTGNQIWNQTQLIVSNKDIYNNFTGTKKYSTPPKVIPNQEEFIYITNPPQGFKTTDKFIKYTVNYSISTQDVNNLVIKILNQDGIPLDEDLKVNNYYIDSQEATQEGNFNKGIVSIMVEYEDIAGAVGITATILNSDTNRQLELVRNCELLDFTDLDGDGYDDITGETEFRQDEYITVTSPNLSSTTSTRLIPLNIWVKILGNDYLNVPIEVYYKNPSNGLYEDLLTSDILNNWNSAQTNRNQIKLWDFYKIGEYLRLNYTVNLLFNEDVLGEIPLMITATSDTTGKTLKVYYKINLLEFVDANGDGIDDNTGEPYNPNPELPNYDDSDMSLDGAIGMLKEVIPTLKAGLSTISNLIGILFGWLPGPIQAFMFAIITIIGITTLLKVIRG